MRASRALSAYGPGGRLPRHRHGTAYAALILRGGYLEAGDAGRFAVGAGDVLFHDRCEAHRDWFGGSLTELIDLPLDRCPAYARGRIDDPDDVVRLAEIDPADAAQLLLAAHQIDDRRMRDWPDLLAETILAGQVDSLAGWADAAGVTPSSVSRGFRLAYGISPQRFRFEARARTAARLAMEQGAALSEVALEASFADQAHMCRAVRAVTGSTALRLRRDNCVQ